MNAKKYVDRAHSAVEKFVNEYGLPTEEEMRDILEEAEERVSIAWDARKNYAFDFIGEDTSTSLRNSINRAEAVHAMLKEIFSRVPDIDVISAS